MGCAVLCEELCVGFLTTVVLQGHALEPLISGYFAESTMTLRTWLRGLQSVVSAEELSLPGWTDVSFATLKHCVNDDGTGSRLLGLLAGLATDAESTSIVSPDTTARPDIAFALPGRVVVTVGCKMLEGVSSHSATVKDNMESTDLRQLWQKSGNVIDERCHAAAMSLLDAAGGWRSVRISVAMATGHAGGVVVSSDTREIKVVVSPPMLSRFLEGTGWAGSAEQVLHMAGIPPRVQLLDGEPEQIGIDLLQLYGMGPARRRQWLAALSDLKGSYMDEAEPVVTTKQVKRMIQQHVPAVEKALFHPRNVGRWEFGKFTFTPDHLVQYATLG